MLGTAGRDVREFFWKGITMKHGFSVPEDETLVGAYRALGREAVDVFRSHSDATLFHEAGVPTLVLGPGRLEYAHASEERIEFSEVEEAAQLYVALASRVLG